MNDDIVPLHAMKNIMASGLGLPRARVEFYEMDPGEVPNGVYLNCTVSGMKKGEGGIHVKIDYEKKVEFMNQPLMEFVPADEVPEAYQKFVDRAQYIFTYLAAIAFGFPADEAVAIATLWNGTGMPGFPGLDSVIGEEE